MVNAKSFPHSRLNTGFVARLTRRVSLEEQELLTLPKHLSSPPVFSGVRVTRSLVLYVCFVDRCLSFCPFSFGHCVVCSSSIYGFWLPLLVSSNSSYLFNMVEHYFLNCCCLLILVYDSTLPLNLARLDLSMSCWCLVYIAKQHLSLWHYD